ncbi:MAG: aconitase family protein, partial [Methanothrix sp.]
AAIAMVYGELWLRIPETVKIVLTGAIPRGIYSKDIILNIIGEFKTDGMIGKAVEFHGNVLTDLSIDSRMTITNMCTEMGAESAIIPIDGVALKWLNERGYTVARRIDTENLGEYIDTVSIDVSKLEPTVAVPPDVDNVVSVDEVEGVEVDQVFIGSCTNGRLEDLEIVARILKGKKVKARTIIIPASREVLLNALKKGNMTLLRSR